MKELSDKEVIQAAIEKAIEGKYKLPLNATHFATERYTVQFFDENREFLGTTHRNAILFDHEFCKALFGEEWVYIHDGFKKMKANSGPGPESQVEWVNHGQGLLAWQYHGTQMFLAENRIDYLRKNI